MALQGQETPQATTHKNQEKTFQNKAKLEEAHILHQEKQLDTVIEEKVRTGYVLLSGRSSSVHQNAQRVLGDTPQGFYFFFPSNLAFRDLTPGKCLPPATRIVMGLSSKFIPNCKTATTKKKSMESFERFE